MVKIIHVTDTHLVRAGEQLHGLDPLDRFQRCVRSIQRSHADAHCVVMTGDIADRGELEAYRLFHREMRETGLPVYSILGNHDNRAVYREQFPDAAVDDNGYVQSIVPTPAGVFLLLDTLIEGSHGGSYCPLRQAWLAEQLHSYRDDSVFIFMHHPPFNLHLPCIDAIGLEEKLAFADLVASHNNIRHLFFGHAHRALSGQWNGVSFSSLRGTNHQVGLDFERDTIAYVHEDPEYAVVFIDDDQIVVHTHSYFSDTICQSS